MGTVDRGAGPQGTRGRCSPRWRTRSSRLIPVLRPGRTPRVPPPGPPSASRTWPIPPPLKRLAEMLMGRIGRKHRRNRIGRLPRSVHPYRRRPVRHRLPPPWRRLRPSRPHPWAGRPRQDPHPCRYPPPRTWRSRRPPRYPCRLPRPMSLCPRSCRLRSIPLVKTIRGGPLGFGPLGTPRHREPPPRRWRPGRVGCRSPGFGGTMPCSMRTCPGTSAVPGSG